MMFSYLALLVPPGAIVGQAQLSLDRSSNFLPDAPSTSGSMTCDKWRAEHLPLTLLAQVRPYLHMPTSKTFFIHFTYRSCLAVLTVVSYVQDQTSCGSAIVSYVWLPSSARHRSASALSSSHNAGAGVRAGARANSSLSSSSSSSNSSSTTPAESSSLSSFHSSSRSLLLSLHPRGPFVPLPALSASQAVAFTVNERTIVAEASLSPHVNQQLRLRSSALLLNCSPVALEVSLCPQVVGANPSRQRVPISRSLSSLLQRKGKARVGEGEGSAGDGGKEGSGVEEGAVAVDEVFENQRHLPLSEWRGGNLLPTDLQRWTAREGGSNVSPAKVVTAAAATAAATAVTVWIYS